MVILGWNGGESNTGVYAGDALIKSPLRGGTFLAIDFPRRRSDSGSS